MMQRWSEDTIRFMEDASSYGNYHEELSRILLPYLPTDGHICDAGCGLGHLALELSKTCKSVTAVDASANALRGLLSKELPENLHIIQGDIFSMEDRFDAMIFCYFGKAHEILRLATSGRTGRILVVRRDCSVHHFSGTPVLRKKHSINTLTQMLEERKIPYVSENISLELGQPFRRIEDSLQFFRLYNKSQKEVSLCDLEGKLTLTESKEFPLYYPNVREMELIVFDTKNISEKV